ncbi:MAG: hypothetical protein WBJ21_06360 [Burkholderiaceae bacterium]
MANRDELLIIRAARTGQAAAQLALGKRYLFGGGGLPRSLGTALHWLERAAEQNQEDAWLLIGSHIPLDVARHSSDPRRVALWYERAFEAGVAKAGLVLALLVFASWAQADNSLRQKAMRALQKAAESGLPDAQWLLAQQLGIHEMVTVPQARLQPNALAHRKVALEWASRAARGGVIEAQRAVTNYAWSNQDYTKYLFWALPMAHEIERRSHSAQGRSHAYSQQDLDILSRCAQALLLTADPSSHLIERYLKLAAEGGDSGAQISLGLWIARMDADGGRVNAIPGVAHYKRAIRWLSMAGEQGVAAAWYAMSRIYLKPEFSRRSISEARRHLEMAAAAGHVKAQLDMGLTAWRCRRLDPRSDIKAVYWLQKAFGQGNQEAGLLLEKIAPQVKPAEWANAARLFFTRDMSNQYPFLAARVELGYWFGLSRAESLLLDVETADHGHCLEVDIRAEHPRSRRRLIQIKTGEQRQALDRLNRLTESVEAGTNAPEGNYRQRLYRFRNLLSKRRSQARKIA